MLKTHPNPTAGSTAIADRTVTAGTTGTMSDPDWHDRGACKGPCQAIFFPPARLERRTDRRRREARAKEICSSCGVQDQCLAYAMEISEQHGIWGGLTARERRAMKVTVSP